ncbi:hypothetical protein ABXV17_21025 [Vibrio harveyi]|uniref:hypothetical protein n=1 Tax=Vibrio harveyi TaxID=669 RepID=UPI002A2B6871|nr:hypothetical protein [Vibrio harveyi]
MKKLLLTAAIATLTATPVLAKPSDLSNSKYYTCTFDASAAPDLGNKELSIMYVQNEDGSGASFSKNHAWNEYPVKSKNTLSFFRPQDDGGLVVTTLYFLDDIQRAGHPSMFAAVMSRHIVSQTFAHGRPDMTASQIEGACELEFSDN